MEVRFWAMGLELFHRESELQRHLLAAGFALWADGDDTHVLDMAGNTYTDGVMIHNALKYILTGDGSPSNIVATCSRLFAYGRYQ